MSIKQQRILFVCLGNICRSPTAEAVFRQKVVEQHLQSSISIDSAGTGDWHVGHPSDKRSQQYALKRGVDMSQIRARQVTPDDFEQFDYVLAMDQQNLKNLEAMKPKNFRGYLGLFLNFTNDPTQLEVPDPYYGGDQGFENVLDLIETASDGLLQAIKAQP